MAEAVVFDLDSINPLMLRECDGPADDKGPIFGTPRCQFCGRELVARMTIAGPGFPCACREK